MTADAVNVLEMVQDHFKHLKKISGVSERPTFGRGAILTGFKFLDHFTGGLARGDYIILAGRVSSGKTVFSLNIALNVLAAAEKKVLFFSLAETKERIVEKIFDIIARIPADRRISGGLDIRDLARIEQRLSCFSDAYVLVQDEIYSMSGISAAIAESAGKWSNIGLIVVDFLQLIDNTDDCTAGSRADELARASRQFRRITRRTGIPILLISSVDSSVDLREFNKRPLLTDINGPCSIMDDCDMVWMLYRDEMYLRSEDNPQRGITELAILKNRRGRLNTMELSFIEDCQKFEDITAIFG